MTIPKEIPANEFILELEPNRIVTAEQGLEHVFIKVWVRSSGVKGLPNWYVSPDSGVYLSLEAFSRLKLLAT